MVRPAPDLPIYLPPPNLSYHLTLRTPLPKSLSHASGARGLKPRLRLPAACATYWSRGGKGSGDRGVITNRLTSVTIIEAVRSIEFWLRDNGNMISKVGVPRSTAANKRLHHGAFGLNRVHQVVSGPFVQQFTQRDDS